MSEPVDVVVVGYRCRELLLSCCAAALADGDVELIVVDNASEDGTVTALREAFPSIRVIENERNEGFARAVNRGIRAGDSELVLLLNPDARLESGALERLRSALREDPEAVAAGPRIRAPDGSLELSVNRTMSLLGDLRIRLLEALYARGRGPAAPFLERAYSRSSDAESLSAACLLLRRRPMEEIGGLDERFFLYAEDVDLCLRLRAAGWRLRYVADAAITHVRGASGTLEREAVERAWRASQLTLYRKHRTPAALAVLRLWVTCRYGIAAGLGLGERRRRARRMLRWLREGPS